MLGSRFLVSFFVRLEGGFSVPACAAPVTPRAVAVKDGRCSFIFARPALRRPPPQAARSVLGGGEHGVTLRAVGTATISSPVAVKRTRRRGPWKMASMPHGAAR
jgi:hypothetical protein